MKKVLIVCYYWPPAGGPGVQRWLQFVKYLPEYGIQPIVYVPENPHYPLTDESLLAEVPAGITILKNPIWEPYGIAGSLSKKDTKDISSGIIPKEKKQSWLQRSLLYIRGNFFIPDARKYWVNPSVKFLSDYLKNNPVDALITTGPPHSLHLIGLRLKAKFYIGETEKNLSWFADFRDPWTTIGYHDKLRLSKSSQRKHRKLEQQVLNNADYIIATSPTTANDFRKITKTAVSLITNGYEGAPRTSERQDVHFSLAHTGSLLSERNPEVLWQALSELKTEVPGFSTDLKIKLAGKVSENVLESIETFGLKENLELLGYVAHSKVTELQDRAVVLLLIEINSPDTRAIIPGKLFEYLRAQRPIIALGPENADFISILEVTQSGRFFNYGQIEELKTELRKLYGQFKNSSIAYDGKDIALYSRKILTGKLATLLRTSKTA